MRRAARQLSIMGLVESPHQFGQEWLNVPLWLEEVSMDYPHDALTYLANSLELQGISLKERTHAAPSVGEAWVARNRWRAVLRLRHSVDRLLTAE